MLTARCHRLFLGSKHIHARLSGLVGRDAAFYSLAGICGLTMIVTHACALPAKTLIDLENCFVPNIFVQSGAHECAGNESL